MKRYTVEVTEDVVSDIRAAFRFIFERSPQRAEVWLHGLYQAIDTLESFPNRCSLIREQAAFSEPVRQLIYHSHRIIFTVVEERCLVQVHAFRHGAQDDIPS